MNQHNSDKQIWKYIGLIAIGALAMYQLTSGQEVFMYVILIALIILSFIKYYKE